MPKLNNWTFDDDFDQIEAELRKAVNRAVLDTARDVKEMAQELAPVDTSALKSGAAVTTSYLSEHSAAAAAARAANPKVEIEPDWNIEEDEGIAHAVVHFVVLYAWFVEYGYFNVWAGRYITGQAFLQRALEQHSDTLNRRLSEAIARLESK
jgi:Bacteriophage HK97-gp10, putative tail-component